MALGRPGDSAVIVVLRLFVLLPIFAATFFIAYSFGSALTAALAAAALVACVPERGSHPRVSRGWSIVSIIGAVLLGALCVALFLASTGVTLDMYREYAASRGLRLFGMTDLFLLPTLIALAAFGALHLPFSWRTVRTIVASLPLVIFVLIASPAGFQWALGTVDVIGIPFSAALLLVLSAMDSTTFRRTAPERTVVRISEGLPDVSERRVREVVARQPERDSSKPP